MLSGQVMPVSSCASWCADQGFHANTESILLVVIVGICLVVYQLIDAIYPRLQNPPVSEAVMEKVMKGLITLSVLLLIIFFYYHFYIYEPQYHAGVIKGFTDTGYLLNNSFLNNITGWLR